MPVGVDSGYASVNQLCTSGNAHLIPKAVKINILASESNPIRLNEAEPVSVMCSRVPANKSNPDTI